TTPGATPRRVTAQAHQTPSKIRDNRGKAEREQRSSGTHDARPAGIAIDGPEEETAAGQLMPSETANEIAHHIPPRAVRAQVSALLAPAPSSAGTGSSRRARSAYTAGSASS